MSKTTIPPKPTPLEASVVTDPAVAATVETPPADPAIKAVRGRALVDLPNIGLACGDFGELPEPDAVMLIAGGQFDDQAPWPEA
jgi:hypothetical protein